jgi:hypothetical protein
MRSNSSVTLHRGNEWRGRDVHRRMPINAVHCGVAVPAQLVSALLVTGAVLLGEAVAVKFRALRKRPVTTIHKDGVEVADDLFKAPRREALIADGVDQFQTVPPPAAPGAADSPAAARIACWPARRFLPSRCSAGDPPKSGKAITDAAQRLRQPSIAATVLLQGGGA